MANYWLYNTDPSVIEARAPQKHVLMNNELNYYYRPMVWRKL
jgi:hypothetical protein